MPVRTSSFVLLAASAIAPVPVAAQSANDLQRQVSAMQAEIARLTAQVAELQAQQSARASAGVPEASDSTQAPEAETEIAWKGAPEITMDGGWSFKPRGRLQIDSAYISAPDAVTTSSVGFATEFRRAFLGVEGTVPGGFGYRLEADVANSEIDLTDVFLTYDVTDQLTLTVGQHKPFQGLEELTSDLFTSMLERAAFTSAFGFERRVGLSGTYSTGDVMIQLGAFTDNAADLALDSNNSNSLDGRVVFSPEVAGGVLHLGASAHFRDLNDATNTVRYRARPFVHTTDLRLVDTRSLPAHGERSFGAEFAYIKGPLHVTAEGHRMTALGDGIGDPTFWGGYAEVGLLVTPGDTTAYRNGAYDRIRPVNPVSQGGIGAIQLNARLDHLDLNDGSVVGGGQDALGLSAIWIPSEYVRFVVNYGHLWITDAAISAGSESEYQVDTVGMRTQIDF
jgi:phosphate-selective porin OprO/OprP